MNTCDDHWENGDNAVVYDGSKCPVCVLESELKEKIEEVEKERDDAQSEADSNGEEASDLEEKLEEAKTERDDAVEERDRLRARVKELEYDVEKARGMF